MTKNTINKASRSQETKWVFNKNTRNEAFKEKKNSRIEQETSVFVGNLIALELQRNEEEENFEKLEIYLFWRVKL